jgi:hypothetical protein
MRIFVGKAERWRWILKRPVNTEWNDAIEKEKRTEGKDMERTLSNHRGRVEKRGVGV